MAGTDSPELTAMVKGAVEQSVGRDYHWPGNVRELEQAVRRILLTRAYAPQRQDGSLEGSFKAGYDLKANKKI